jgi:hypothetical protein
LEGEFSLSDMSQFQRDRLREMFERALGFNADKVKLLSQWGPDPTFAPIETGDEVFDQIMRWRPRNLAIVAGDYGSGKSTFAQILAMKLITGPTLGPVGARMTICAWEEDRGDFRDRVWRFQNGLEHRIFWFQPDADPDRLIEEYLTNIEYLARSEGVGIHLVDPWNSFSHEFEGDTETKYIEKMLNRLQRLTQELDMTIIVVTHTPRRLGSSLDFRPFRIGDASGSQHWGNKADMGFCISRTTKIAEMSDLDAALPRGMTRIQVESVTAQHGPFMGKEHMIAVLDKVKVEGMDKHGMGWKAIRAFVFDRESNALVHDSAATEIAKLLWR